MCRSRPFRCALGLVIVLLGGALAVQPASADGIGDQQQQVQQVVAELDRLHQKVGQLNEQYVTALNEKAVLDGEITLAQQKIADQQAQLGTLEGQLANVAVQKFMGGANDALGPLFTDPNSIDDGLARDHLARVAVNAGAATTDDYHDLLTKLDKAQRDLERKQQKELDLANRAEDSRVKAEKAAADLEVRFTQEKAKLGDLIAKEEKRQSDAAAASYAQQVADSQAKAQAQAAAAAKSTGSGSSTKSGGAGSAVAAGSSAVGAGNGSATDASGNGSDPGGGGGGGNSPPPVSGRAAVAVRAAQSQLGVPYQFAQASPGVAFDCSGITSYAWSVAGVGIPHQSAAQYASTPHVPKDQAQPGDLIFYYSPISHVGIYIGGGSMIHSPQTGSFVSVTSVRWDKVVGVSRPG